MSPARTTLRLTTAGRILLPFGVACLIMSWLVGGAIGLFSATCFAVLLVAAPLSWLHARRLRVLPPVSARVTVGDLFVLEPAIVNDAAVLHARNVVLTTGTGEELARTSAHVLDVRAGETMRVPIVHRLLERGRKRRLNLTLSSSFPLGLVRTSLRFELPVDLLGLPRLGSLHDLGQLPASGELFVPEQRREARGEEEFFGVRDWREGESLRRVHWRLTARRRRRIVREFRHRVEVPVHVVLATCAEPVPPYDVKRRMFERSVSLTATLVEHFLRRGRSVRMTLAGPEPFAIGSLRGRTGLLRALAVLAEVRSSPGDPLDALRTALVATRSRETAVVVLVGGGAARAGRELGRDVLVIDVEDRRTDGVFLQGRAWGTGALPVLAR
ncbi:MAG: DUF58 domain-containing protein [Planctomycetota bacterium]|nr:DUF58 domain-containing protein [Planctomycetota bacterium]